ncbi:MAG: hypothetical protein HYZ36_03605, partial [Pedosphaera parvula]|nr:hypothetical protein [Pedosphaera parvula]
MKISRAIPDVMKRLLILCVGGWLLAGQVGAQPTPVVDLFGVHEYPPEGPLDAVIINNHGTIDAVNTLFSWDTQNTLQFVNQIGGQMYGAPGFWLDHVDGDTFERSPLLSFTNLGSIFATTRLVISATNLANAPNALLSADRGGTVHLEALNGTMNLFNSKIRAGESSTRGNAFEGDFIINDTLYYNPANVMDEYWGMGGAGLLDLDILNIGGISDPDGHWVTNRA